MDTLDELGYEVADANITGKDDPKIIDGKISCHNIVSVLFWSDSAVTSISIRDSL